MEDEGGNQGRREEGREAGMRCVKGHEGEQKTRTII